MYHHCTALHDRLLFDILGIPFCLSLPAQSLNSMCVYGLLFTIHPRAPHRISRPLVPRLNNKTLNGENKTLFGGAGRCTASFWWWLGTILLLLLRYQERRCEIKRKKEEISNFLIARSARFQVATLPPHINLPTLFTWNYVYSKMKSNKY